MKDVNLFDRVSWKAVKEAKGLTYQQIADELGLFRGSVEKWFTGEKRPSILNAIALARVLGIPLEKVLADIDDLDVRALLRLSL
ncbi:helix-turn-helix transcriptional regulator [Streptomyces afghaniensis]|uniref:helix-turn-helix transcriptional regulator n=1 Tax=Streptomyces afghaniensis TaxID=66865 RepID=UPI0037D0976E